MHAHVLNHPPHPHTRTNAPFTHALTIPFSITWHAPRPLDLTSFGKQLKDARGLASGGWANPAELSALTQLVGGVWVGYLSAER